MNIATRTLSAEDLAARKARDALKSKARHDAILRAAVALSVEGGYQWITREQVAARAGVAQGSINHAFGTMLALKRAVVRHAIETGILEIVKDALAGRSPAADDVPPELRAKAAALLL